MLFTSYVFFVFLPIVFAIYWLLYRHRQYQNILLLVASYVFYGWWDWRFLFLIFFSSSLDFFIANAMGQTNHLQKRKILLWSSVLLNLGLLAYFKYFNFFIDSFNDLLVHLGSTKDGFDAINVILPLGISFYTFQTLGYTIDVYKHRLKPSTNFIEYITFVSFFPQLVAGPIERATNLLPQFLKNREWKNSKVVDGLRQILWGFFKKVAIADALATNVNYIFENYQELNGITLAAGAIMFTFQMYCDFSGYSDIAIGTARLLGFNLMKNFNFPFFSTSMSEFWRRWHISLSTWILDYLYTPLSINRRYWGLWGVVFAAVLSFTLSGLWHGAAWTFVIWGLLHGLALGYEVLTKKKRKRWFKKFGLPYVWLSRFLVFTFWVITLTIFRAQSAEQAWGMLSGILRPSLFASPQLNLSLLLWAAGLLVFEYFQRHREHGFDVKGYHYSIRWSLYALALIFIFSSDNLNNKTEFIYFQF